MSKIMERDFHQADYARQVFRANPYAGTTLAEVLEPEYWAHVAKKINPHDIIEVVPEDGSYFARLFVLNTGKLSVKVKQIEYVELNAVPIGASAPKPELQFEAKFVGPKKWNVIRKSDNETVSETPFVSREDAEKWIESNGKDLMAA